LVLKLYSEKLLKGISIIEFANHTRPNIVCEQNPDYLILTLTVLNKNTARDIVKDLCACLV